MYCSHPDYGFRGDPRPYTGSVAETEGARNTAAHGGVRMIQECRSCGARRNVLINGLHREYGQWGVSRTERRAAYDAARVAASRLIAAIPRLTCGQAEAWVGSDGMIRVVGTDRPIFPAEWLQQARAAREAVLWAEACERDV